MHSKPPRDFLHLNCVAVDGCTAACCLFNCSGKTPLDWAISEENVEVEHFLRSKGVRMLEFTTDILYIITLRGAAAQRSIVVAKNAVC
jgi:hypothetical protein